MTGKICETGMRGTSRAQAGSRPADKAALHEDAAKREIAVEDVTQSELEDALDAVLAELIVYRLRSRPKQSDPLKVVNATEWLGKPVRSRRACNFLNVIKDPIEGSLLYTVRGIGETLFDLGGTDLMREVWGSVAMRDPANEGRRLSVCGSRWDGIGKAGDRWLA